jgi:hypothetical protein
VAVAAAPLIRRIRLTAGLILFTCVFLHYVNHSLGLVSYGAMERGLDWALLI